VVIEKLIRSVVFRENAPQRFQVIQYAGAPCLQHKDPRRMRPPLLPAQVPSLLFQLRRLERVH